MLRTTIVAATTALLLAACASAETSTASTAAQRDCFRALDVDGYGVIDEHRVRVTVSPQREYILTIPRNTRDLDWTHAISIRSTTSFICVGSPAGVQLMGGDPPQPYQVTAIERAPPTAPAGS
jgi:hypothetical protein